MSSDAPEPLRSTEGMVDYDQHSAVQQGLVTRQAGRIAALVEAQGLVEPELKIVDYGCGPGRSAIEAVRPAVTAYRARFPRSPIAVCHADQPGNDWNALFALAAGPTGYGSGQDGVRTEAAVGSFYDQMVAPASVALATCFVASQWSSHAIRLLAPNTVWFADLEGDARAEMAAVARADWVRFLRCRALELRPGGSLLVSTLGAVPDAGEVNGVAVSGRGIYRAINLVAQDMANDGLLDRDVLDRFLFALWFMTAEEVREPIERDPFLSQAFRIQELGVEPAPENPADIFADAIADPVSYAALYTGYMRAFADSTLRTQLFEPCAEGEADRDRLAKEFYNRFDKLYRDFPARYACETWHLTVVLQRR